MEDARPPNPKSGALERARARHHAPNCASASSKLPHARACKATAASELSTYARPREQATGLRVAACERESAEREPCTDVEAGLAGEEARPPPPERWGRGF